MEVFVRSLAAGSPESICRPSLDRGGHGSGSVEGSGAGVGLAWIRLSWSMSSLGALTHASLYTNAQRQRQLGFVLDIMKDS